MGIETTALIAYASLAASLAGAGISYYSQRKQAEAQEDIGAYNAKVAAQAAENEADVARENTKRMREANRLKLERIRGMQAKSGIQIGTGSALDVISEVAGEHELQVLDFFRESEQKQRQLASQGAMSMWEGGQGAQALRTQSVGTLFSGVSSAFGSYTSSKNAGLFDSPAVA